MEGLMSSDRRHIREDDTIILRIESFVNIFMIDVSVLYQISDISFLRSTYTKKRRNFTVKILLYI